MHMPGGADLYADSVALGHPGRLATVYCGFKAEVQLSPGTHTIVVDYTGIFNEDSVHVQHHSQGPDHRSH